MEFVIRDIEDSNLGAASLIAQSGRLHELQAPRARLARVHVADRARKIGSEMKLFGLRRLGIATDQPDAMVGFLPDTLGLRVELAEQTTTELSLHNGDRVRVFSPGNPYHNQYRSQGIVALFELNDMHAARRELEESGVEVGELRSDAAWVDVRAPDGRLYVLAGRLTGLRGGVVR